MSHQQKNSRASAYPDASPFTTSPPQEWQCLPLGIPLKRSLPARCHLLPMAAMDTRASKWASERFLERVNAAFDLPVWIHRPSGIMRPPNEEHNQDELLLSILHFSKKIKAVPETHLIQGTLDLVSIENVSRNIVKDVLENNPWTPNSLSYVHQTGDIVIPLDQMKEYIERESEEPLPVVEKLTLTEWAERAVLLGLHSSLANVLKNADQIGILQMHIPKLVRKYRN